MNDESQPVRPEDDPDVDQEALAAHRAEAEAAAEEEVGTPEAKAHEPLAFDIEIKSLSESQPVPDARQIEKWIEMGLERHGGVAEVTARRK